MKKLYVSIAAMLLIGAMASYFFQNRYARVQLPPANEISHSAGFEVLIPELPNSEYRVIDFEIHKVSNIENAVIIAIQGPRSIIITITQSPIPEDRRNSPLDVSVFNRLNPRKVELIGHTAYLFIKPSGIDDNIQTKMLTWNDSQRHFNLLATPASAISDEDIISLAEKLY